MLGRFSSTAASVLRLIKMEDNSNRHLQKITELNNATHRVKELDGATQILPEADAAISTLQKWKDTRHSENTKMTEKELAEKQEILTNASTKFTIAKYLMISCSAVNILTMFYLFSKNEDHKYANNPWLDQLCKMPGRLSIVGALEGSIHLYKAKRGYVQLQQLAKAELEAVAQAMEEVGMNHSKRM